MNKKQEIKLFEEQKVRMEWDDEKEKWFFSIVDVCAVLTESKDYLTARKYWNKLKQRLKEEGNETVTNIWQKDWHLTSAKKFVIKQVFVFKNCLHIPRTCQRCR